MTKYIYDDSEYLTSEDRILIEKKIKEISEEDIYVYLYIIDEEIKNPEKQAYNLFKDVENDYKNIVMFYIDANDGLVFKNYKLSEEKSKDISIISSNKIETIENSFMKNKKISEGTKELICNTTLKTITVNYAYMSIFAVFMVGWLLILCLA